MAHRILVASKVLDARAEVKKRKINDLNLEGKVREVEVITAYTLDPDVCFN